MTINPRSIITASYIAGRNFKGTNARLIDKAIVCLVYIQQTDNTRLN